MPAKKSSAKEAPQEPRTVRALQEAFIGNVLRKQGEVFIHAGPLGKCLEEVAEDDPGAPQNIMQKLVSGEPLQTHKPTGSYAPPTPAD